MRVTTLASGSGGNATLICAGGTRVLVDAGVGPTVIEARMRAVFGEVLALDGILLTHPHGDHAGKAEACALRFGCPVWLTEPTRRSLRLSLPVRTRVFGAKARFDVGAIRVEPLPIPHDAPNVALVLEHAGHRAAVVTDLGHVPAGLAKHLDGCQAVLLESNHDPEMLARGPYPDFLKRRIASRTGHLNNDQAAQLIRRLGRGLKELCLLHISQRCNAPELALDTARAALRHDARLTVACQQEPLDFEVRGRAVAVRAATVNQLALPF